MIKERSKHKVNDANSALQSKTECDNFCIFSNYCNNSEFYAGMCDVNQQQQQQNISRESFSHKKKPHGGNLASKCFSLNRVFL